MAGRNTEITVRGCCHVYCALDIGFSIDLKQCASLLRETCEEGEVHRHAPGPAFLDLHPAPVRLIRPGTPISGSLYRADDRVAMTIYDFGAVSVEYRVPFAGPLEHLVTLSSELYDTQRFASDARQRAESLLEDIHSTVRRPLVRPDAEDYLVFEIPSLDGANVKPSEFVNEHQLVLAQLLSSNTKALSRQQVREELRRSIAYFDDDLTIITWNAALMFGTQMEDVLTVLELANVQLRELHYLDDRLDTSLQESYDLRAQTKSVKTLMQRIRELMLDGQAFSEAVTNAFKPFPDAFSARVYALASRAMGLDHFDRSIRDKLSLLNTLYTTLADEAGHERAARLEWIVIILIFIEILMGLGEKFFHS
jgi:hypothetical protein